MFEIKTAEEHSVLQKVNTVDGITALVNDLEKLNFLVDTRRNLYYKQKINLEQFVVLGTYVLDTCGNCGLFQLIDIEKIKDSFGYEVPKVMLIEDFRKRVHGSVSYSFERNVAPHNKKCPICHEGWTINNPSDFIFECKFDMISCVGKTPKEIIDELSKDEYFVPFINYSEPFLRNSKYIDMTLTKFQTTKNSHGRVGKEEGITQDYVMQQNDELEYNKFIFTHKKCYKQRTLNRVKEAFQKAFQNAGYVIKSVYEIPNEYCQCDLCASWFIFGTDKQLFKIGWRKRVINLQSNEVDFCTLFPNEDVTKGDDYIHAWGYEKLEEYLKKIREK